MDYYEILGVGKDANEKEIKRAYKKLVKKYHPDANPGDKDAAKKFRKVTEAYAALSDPDQKAKYDRTEQWKSEEQAGRKEDPDQKAKVYQFRSKKQQDVLRLIRPAIMIVLMLVLSVLAIRGGGEFPGSKPQVRYWLDNLVEWVGKYKGAAAIVLSLLSGLYMYIRLPGGKFRMVFTAVFTALIPYLAFLSVEAYNRGFWHVGAPVSYEILPVFPVLGVPPGERKRGILHCKFDPAGDRHCQLLRGTVPRKPARAVGFPVPSDRRECRREL